MDEAPSRPRVGREAVLLSALVFATSCGALAGGSVDISQPRLAPPSHAVQLTVRTASGPVTGAYCWLDGVTDHASGPSDDNGTIVFTYVPLSLRDTLLNCRGDGFQPFREHRLLTGAEPEPTLVAVLVPRV